MHFAGFEPVDRKCDTFHMPVYSLWEYIGQANKKCFIHLSHVNKNPIGCPFLQTIYKLYILGIHFWGGVLLGKK